MPAPIARRTGESVPACEPEQVSGAESCLTLSVSDTFIALGAPAAQGVSDTFGVRHSSVPDVSDTLGVRHLGIRAPA
jgi:hypothetical protein